MEFTIIFNLKQLKIARQYGLEINIGLTGLRFQFLDYMIGIFLQKGEGKNS